MDNDFLEEDDKQAWMQPSLVDIAGKKTESGLTGTSESTGGVGGLLGPA